MDPHSSTADPGPFTDDPRRVTADPRPATDDPQRPVFSPRTRHTTPAGTRDLPTQAEAQGGFDLLATVITTLNA